MLRDTEAFDATHADALRKIWFLGDVHSSFKHIARALERAVEPPKWLVFLGDVDISDRPFRSVLEPWYRQFPSVRFAFIHGNHDADSYAHWEMLHDCGGAVPLHVRVVELNGIRIAGLGGTFLGRVWSPPATPTFQSKEAAMNRGSYQWRDGQRPNPGLLAAIYPDDIAKLSNLRADILVTHEAPSCHPYGFEAIDELSWDMQVVRTFHGHHHDDLSDEYALVRDQLGFDARAVNFRAIKNGLGEHVLEVPNRPVAPEED